MNRAGVRGERGPFDGKQGIAAKLSWLPQGSKAKFRYTYLFCRLFQIRFIGFDCRVRGQGQAAYP